MAGPGAGVSMRRMGTDKMADTLEILKPWMDRAGYHPPKNQYEVYTEVARMHEPLSYLEIGVWHGWSAMAVLLGWPLIREVALVDDESRKVSLEEARQNIWEMCHKLGWLVKPSVRLVVADTKTLTELPGDGVIDLIHVDGEHTTQAVLHDLELALPRLSLEGTILVDDYSIPKVKAGVDQFEAEHPELMCSTLDSYRVHRLMRNVGSIHSARYL